MSFNDENNEIDTDIFNDIDVPKNINFYDEIKQYFITLELDVIEMKLKNIKYILTVLDKNNNYEYLIKYCTDMYNIIEVNDKSYNKVKKFEILKIIDPYISKIIFDTDYNYSKSFFINFIKHLTTCKNGHFLLEKYKTIISNYEEIYLKYILSTAKFNSFKIIFDTNKNKNNFIEIKKILVASAINYDDRVFKFVINFYKEEILNDKTNEYLTVIFFTHLFKHPERYILKRIKYIENLININDNYIYNMFRNHNMTKNLLRKLLKFYYINKSNIIFNSDIIIEIITYSGLECKDVLYQLKTLEEKNIFCFYYIKIYNILIDEKYISDHFKLLDGYFYNKYKFGIDKYTDSKLDNIIRFYNLEYKFVPRIYLIPYFKDHFKYIKSFLYNKEYIKMIYLYIKLSSFIRRIKMKKVVMRRLFLSPIIHELNNLKPNDNIKVLNDGTRFYKNKIQKYNTVPPHHMFPNEIEGMENVLIREKADGTFITELPKNILPKNNFNKVKAEYIEELDLYLVFDINTDMDIEDRYKYLRSCHNSTNNTNLITINNINDMIYYLEEERKIFENFINQDYDIYRWYPKVAFKINVINDEIAKELYNFINMESIMNKHNNSGLYNNDGYIITPLNGFNEIKIKPKDKMSIDLECRNGSMYDREGNYYGDEKLLNGIYRKYPNGEYEYRYDKFKPNSYKIINNIVHLNKIYYKINEKKYFHDNKFKYSLSWEKITTNNKNNLIDMNGLMHEKSNTLDLGCGKGKVLSITKNKNYTGYDYDHYILNQARNKFNNVIFNYIDLRYDWNKTDEKYYEVKYNNYMNIYAINSLMHFNTEKFWEQINRVSIKGTRFMFNLLDDNDNNYQCDDDYLKKIDKNTVEIYFSSIHNKPITEKFITIKDVIPFLEKYHFNIIYEKQYNNDNLTKLYKWYIVEKLF
jgi:hypothetical protein